MPPGRRRVDYVMSPVQQADVPIAVHSYTNISSDPRQFINGVIPAGQTTAQLVVPRIECGQLDMKAVFTTPGDSSGNIAGPVVTWGDVCQATTTTSTAPTTVSPSSVSPTSVRPTIPATGTGGVIPWIWSLPAFGLADHADRCVPVASTDGRLIPGPTRWRRASSPDLLGRGWMIGDDAAPGCTARGCWRPRASRSPRCPTTWSDPDTVVWVDLCGPSRDQLHELADELGLHELAVEDALGPHQRPKLDHYATHWFLSCHTVRVNTDAGTADGDRGRRVHQPAVAHHGPQGRRVLDRAGDGRAGTAHRT